jgi:uncharacterized membrane protein YadS
VSPSAESAATREEPAGAVLFAAALFGLGTAVRLPALLRTGRRGLVLGALATVLVSLLALERGLSGS